MMQFKFFRKGKAEKQSLKAYFSNLDKKSWNMLFFLVLIVVSGSILSINLFPAQVTLHEGEIATEDYFYEEATTTYVSDLRTEQARNEAAAAVEEQYIIDETVIANLENEISGYFSAITETRNGGMTIVQLNEELPGDYDNELLNTMITLPEDELAVVRDDFESIVRNVYGLGILEDDIEEARQNIAIIIGTSTFSGNVELFLKSLNSGLDYSYNKVFDAVTTAHMIQQAQDGVKPVQVTIQQGERLVSRGQVVTAGQVEALQALGLLSDNRMLTPHIGLIILVALSFSLLYFYLKFYQKEIFNRKSSLLLLGVVTAAILLICKLISLISFNINSQMTGLVGYLLPVAAASMVLAVLLNREIAVFCTILLAIFVGIAMNGDLAYTLVALAGGLAGIITASRLNQRSQFMGASIYITLANILMIGSWGLIWHQSYQTIGFGMIFGLINGLLSAIFAMGILPYLESSFGVTTVMRLLELSNSNHPLLKRLMIEAPGTYNHSILVGNLAEGAADAIGSDTLLVRVASYYHDIGKLKRPHFYIENQRAGENPHDKLQPGLSAMIITSHPIDGVKMLQEARFPEEIIDIVEQHHGNNLLNYFYHKAKELAVDPDEVKIADYCYKGRRPQTKEAALVMLADSVQAAVQPLETNDKEQIEAKVHEIINSRVKEGQLADCPLTFKDLDIIGQSFLMVLSGMNHQRINYANVAEAFTDGTSTERKPAEDKNLNGKNNHQ